MCVLGESKNFRFSCEKFQSLCELVGLLAQGYKSTLASIRLICVALLWPLVVCVYAGGDGGGGLFLTPPQMNEGKTSCAS